jgi:hypothetical protein
MHMTAARAYYSYYSIHHYQQSLLVQAEHIVKLVIELDHYCLKRLCALATTTTAAVITQTFAISKLEAITQLIISE